MVRLRSNQQEVRGGQTMGLLQTRLRTVCPHFPNPNRQAALASAQALKKQ